MQNKLEFHGLIDTHCHLDYDYAPKSLADILQDAMAQGVDGFVTIGTEIPRIPGMQNISERYPRVFHTVGVHPHEASTIQESDYAVLESAVKHSKCVAIGEIGLDYYYEHSPKDLQILHLERQLDLARRTGKPVVIHSRDAEEVLLPLLDRYAKSLGHGKCPGVIHCFSGTEAFGRACLDLGFFISFSGILTFKKSEDLRTAAEHYPLDRIVVETDAPFLAPVPYRGKKCEPSMVNQTALTLSQIKQIPLDQVKRQTTLNAQKLFEFIST